MDSNLPRIIGICTLLLTSILPTAGQSQEKQRIFHVQRVEGAIVIDGVLDEEVWNTAKLNTGDWLTQWPEFGKVMEQRTEAYAAYDDRALYFAFRCLDPEPEKIKTSLSRRDDINNDDWVGVILDSLNTRQISFAHYLNPSGVQSDVIRFASDKGDMGVDWVWGSAARITNEGYIIEMRIPLESIRYKGGEEARMGVCFRRGVRRRGEYVTWPDLPPGEGIFTVMATLVYRDLPEQRTRELLPSVTYVNNSDRSSPDRWSTTDNKADVGINFKYGITSSLTLDATINPDFSQVESDEFQVEVNQRFPIFYSEKRPFFMEGTGIFLMPMAGGELNMKSHVHTRRIVDPIWGAKFSGTLGKMGFSILSASDEASGREKIGGEENPFAGKNTLFTVGRAVYNLGKDNYLGSLFTYTRFAEGYNNVFGFDGTYRLGNHRFTGYALQTFSMGPYGERKADGAGICFGYAFENLNFDFGLAGEHFDDNFRMDTAFYNRTGITLGHLRTALKLYPGEERYPWIKRIDTILEARAGEDRLAGGNEHFIKGSVEFSFTGDCGLTLRYGRGREPWRGLEFDVGRLSLEGAALLTNQVEIMGSVSFADTIYYFDPVRPFAGKSRSQSISVILQPTSKVREILSYSHVDFSRASTGEHIYSIHILNSQSVYQFSDKFFLRAIIRFNSFEKRILTDFLASYTLVPGTVVYAGYGSLIEKRRWEDDQWRYGIGSYLTTRRSFFFKASYLWRF